MSKQPKQKSEERQIGPKFARNVIPKTFQIRRPTSPMADLLDEAAGGDNQASRERIESERSSEVTPVIITPVKSTPVKNTGVAAAIAIEPLVATGSNVLPGVDQFLDAVLPHFPPARQAILLRLYRWSNGLDSELVVSTPRLAAKTNMDEKSCRSHLHALIAEGYLLRSPDGEQIAKFGGSDRASRGLILRLSSPALWDFCK